MVRAEIQGSEFIAVNTDIQTLMRNEAPTRIQIGEKATRGSGSDGNPVEGRRVAEERKEDLQKAATPTAAAERVETRLGWLRSKL